jgi:hypothetical protein
MKSMSAAKERLFAEIIQQTGLPVDTTPKKHAKGKYSYHTRKEGDVYPVDKPDCITCRRLANKHPKCKLICG